MKHIMAAIMDTHSLMEMKYESAKRTDIVGMEKNRVVYVSSPHSIQIIIKVFFLLKHPASFQKLLKMVK